jgi:hypothetical protein
MSDSVVNSLYRIIVNLHIAAGTVALISFWTAGFARKARGGLHVKAGSIYLAAMRGILITAVPMALMAFAKNQPAKGTFLLYLVVIVATTVSSAPRAVRLKADFDAYRGGSFRFFAYALPLSALAAFTFGIVNHVSLLWGFSIVGFAVAWDMQRTLRRAIPEPGWWLRQHYGAMLGNGIGTHIAFLSIGLSRALPPEYAGIVQNLAWFGPVTVALIVRVMLDRRHRRRFGPRASATSAGAVTA